MKKLRLVFASALVLLLVTDAAFVQETEQASGLSALPDAIVPRLLTKNDRLDEILPHGRVQIDIYVFPINPRHEEIAQRFGAAIEHNRDWFAKYRKDHDGHLPYDSRFGITEDEYEEVFAIENRPKVVLDRKDTIEFVRNREHDRIVIRPGETIKHLADIEISNRDLSIESPHGALEYDGWLDANEGQRGTGPWHGLHWQGKEPTNGRRLNFAIGQHIESREGVIYFRTFKPIDSYTLARFPLSDAINSPVAPAEHKRE